MALLLAGMVSAMITLVFLERAILSRIARLGREVREIGAGGEQWGHVAADGADELAGLGNGINSMLDALRESQEESRQAEAELKAHREDLEQLVQRRSQELLVAQGQLLQNDKLASVGQLAAGIAHEINTPIQYVGDNLRALSDSFEDLVALVKTYRGALEQAATTRLAEDTLSQVREAETEHDIEYVLEDTPQAIAQGLEGVQRVAHIVRAMKDFSHVDRGEVSAADINHALQNTLTVARNEYKYVADLDTDFGEIPPVECFASELNQVFLNLLVNAAHAIADTGKRGKITVRTCKDDDHVKIVIGDTGTGIPEAVRGKVFEWFFTTKGVGKGTGQGLSIAHKIIAQRHKGTIHFETEVGKGTQFIIRLPIKMTEKPEAAAVAPAEA